MKFHCSRGHEWEAKHEGDGITVMAWYDRNLEPIERLVGCTRCQFENLKATIGEVSEGPLPEPVVAVKCQKCGKPVVQMTGGASIKGLNSPGVSVLCRDCGEAERGR